MLEGGALSYKDDDMFVDHSLLAFAERPSGGDPEEPPVEPESILELISELVDCATHSPEELPHELLFGQLFDLLQELQDSNPRDPIDGFWSEIGLLGLLEEAVAIPFTAVVQLALKCLLVLYRLSPDWARGFVVDHEVLFVRLIQAPDLLLPSLTLLLLSLDAAPHFAAGLAVHHRLVRRLCRIVDTTSDFILTSAVLTMISELIIRIGTPDFGDARHCRALLATYLGPGLAAGLDVPEILVPAMRLQASMIASFGDVPECPVLDRILQFVRDGRPLVYIEALRLWNCLFCHGVADFERAVQLLETLLGQLAHGGVPRLKVLFLLTNMCAHPDIAACFLGTPIVERMWRCFDVLTCAEKENFLIMVAQIFYHYPVELVDAFPGFQDWANTVFDFAQSARRPELALYFVMGLAQLARDDPDRQADVDFGVIVDGLAELAAIGDNEDLASAAEQVLTTYQDQL
jgi:hypothetical protein